MISGKLTTYNSQVRQNFYSKIYISSSQLLTLFTTPVTLVPGSPGFFYVPRFCHFSKEAGTAYTLNASVRALVRVNTTTCGFFTNTGFMDQAGALTAACQSHGDFVAFAVTFSAAVITGYNGASINITCDTANWTVGTGGLFVSIWYWQYPMVIGFS